jgi:aspartate 1-decarboxylase
MTIEVLYSKIHRVRVTGADLNYIGSITIDRNLATAAHLVEGQKVSIVNINNGERLDTYVIYGAPGSGEITLNGPAARKVQKDDLIIIISYAAMTVEEAKSYQPVVLFPDESTNQLN